MVNALKQKVIVRYDGVIEIRSPELVPGTEAEVIVLLEETLSEEETDDIRLYDEAKAANDETIPFEQAIAEIERSRS